MKLSLGGSVELKRREDHFGELLHVGPGGMDGIEMQ